jgi:hypothetical protein
MKYSTNHLEKTLLSTGSTTKEEYGTLSFVSMTQEANSAALSGDAPLIEVYIELDPDEITTRVV